MKLLPHGVIHTRDDLYETINYLLFHYVYKLYYNCAMLTVRVPTRITIIRIPIKIVIGLFGFRLAFRFTDQRQCRIVPCTASEHDNRPAIERPQPVHEGTLRDVAGKHCEVVAGLPTPYPVRPGS